MLYLLDANILITASNTYYLNSGPKILITAHPRTADPKNR